MQLSPDNGRATCHSHYCEYRILWELQSSERAVKEGEGGRKERWIKRGGGIIERNTCCEYPQRTSRAENKDWDTCTGASFERTHLTVCSVWNSPCARQGLWGMVLSSQKATPPLVLLFLSSHLRVGGNLKQWWNLQRCWIISHRGPAWITVEPVWASQQSLCSAPVCPEFCNYWQDIITTFTHFLWPPVMDCSLAMFQI